ncbi:nitrate- and nitrite sensing domain-containing protein [Streptomyces sp. 549]|uniref:sensor histidine kinase n=1 Tax=Streptomyces sp. 549 TaxID=3049076 RepID=UPI0024C2BAB6|nr:nitrate- and nitrite sensing domain-containing protein [Streptomyces sp. 549]MDK1477070.1 nitrate- and nitrite sensing domain-containing protein [Streptomyces sp. 549]
MRRSKTAPPPPESRGNFTPPRAAVGATGSAEPSATPAASGSSSRFAVRNWRVATRLNAILLIPVLVALVFGGFRVQNSMNTLSDAQDAERTAEIVAAASTYAHALLDERDRTAAPLLKGDDNAEEITKARAATDEARTAFQEAAERAPDTPSLQRRLDGIAKVEPKLDSLRQAAYSSRLSGVQTQLGYVEIQHPLMNLSNELGLGTGNVVAYGRTVYAISLAKSAESLTRSIGTQLLVKPGPGAESKAEQLTAFQSYAYLEDVALSEYLAGGTQQDADRLRSDLRTLQADGKEKIAAAKAQAEAAGQEFVAPPSMDGMIERIGSGAKPTTLASQGITADVWFQSATGKFDVYRGIEEDLAQRAVAEAGSIASDAKREAIVNSAIVLAALLIAFVIAALMARSMSRNMNRLRNAAFDVAEQRLPMLVDQLSRTEPGRVDTNVTPIPIDTRDEIGEVARAFDQVHREAVRLAAEQALLRGNVNAIFTNLSSRNQGLIERQLGLITDLENNEADPDQLESLFRLDHLATRMRRNGENLLVLAGEEPGRRWNQPVPLVDVMRAAGSEVEQYERIEISGVPESEIHGAVVTDLVHLLAELLENATSFSSPQTKVKVTATRLPDGRVMIEIHDKGIGLTAEDFADINHRLAKPPTVDAAVSQRMGLYVVGRLADRHGIRVQLRPSGEQAGTTSLVMLPEAITHGGGGDEFGEDDFTVSRIVPEQELEQQAPPLQAAYPSQPTAAELGFDDSRYDSVQVPDDASSLDPVGRSLSRGERRVALDAQQYEDGYDQPQQDEQQSEYGGYAEPVAEPPYGQQTGYDATGFPEPGYADAGYGSGYHDGSAAQPGYGGGYGQSQAEFEGAGGAGQAPQGYDPGWQDQGYGTVAQPQAESGQAAPTAAGDRVGFDRPGTPSSSSPSTTGAGLPRRDKQGQQPEEHQATQFRSQPEPAEAPQQGARPDEPDWRSANDERWDRAEKVRDPKAGGVTVSGLPRRVPRANLVEGAATQTPQGGPQVSRAPEDVRGRLSNLHRGVRKGRAGGRDATQNDRPGFGPGSTYDQER